MNINKEYRRAEYEDITLTEEDKKQTGVPYNTIETYVDYDAGGYGGFDWTLRKRGYRFVVNPCTKIVTQDGYTIRESTMLGGRESGGFVFIKETKRYSAKELEKIAEAIDHTKAVEAWKESNNALIEYIASVTA